MSKKTSEKKEVKNATKKQGSANPAIDEKFRRLAQLTRSFASLLVLCAPKFPDESNAAKIVSLANVGLGPVYPMTLTRMVNDGMIHGDALAETVVAILAKRKVRGETKVGPVYVTGESFPLPDK